MSSRSEADLQKERASGRPVMLEAAQVRGKIRRPNIAQNGKAGRTGRGPPEMGKNWSCETG